VIRFLLDRGTSSRDGTSDRRADSGEGIQILPTRPRLFWLSPEVSTSYDVTTSLLRTIEIHAISHRAANIARRFVATAATEYSPEARHRAGSAFDPVEA